MSQKKPRSLNSESMIWENRSRIMALEGSLGFIQSGINDMKDNMTENDKQILKKLDHIQEEFSEFKLNTAKEMTILQVKSGLVIGFSSIAGSAIISYAITFFLGKGTG